MPPDWFPHQAPMAKELHRHESCPASVEKAPQPFSSEEPQVFCNRNPHVILALVIQFRTSRPLPTISTPKTTDPSPKLPASSWIQLPLLPPDSVPTER